MVKLLPILFLITSFTLSAQSDVRYFRSEEDFLAHVELPERKLGWWPYIEAHYDEQGRVERKLYFKRKGKIMYQVPEEDRKELLKYLSKRPYIEVAPLIGMLATWKKKEKEKNGKDKPN